MKQFEYHVLDTGPGNGGHQSLSEQKLNRLGLEGWELTAIVSETHSGDTRGYRAVFKRIIPQRLAESTLHPYD